MIRVDKLKHKNKLIVLRKASITESTDMLSWNKNVMYRRRVIIKKSLFYYNESFKFDRTIKFNL